MKIVLRSYFYVKFNRYPKLTKKNGPSSKMINRNPLFISLLMFLLATAFMSKIAAKMSSAQPFNRRTNLPALPRVMSNGSDLSGNVSTRLPSTGDPLRRISSTGKFNQPNSDRVNITATAPSGVQRQSSTVNELIFLKRILLKMRYFLATIGK